MFLGFEELPLLVSSSSNKSILLYYSLLTSFITILLCSLLTILCASSTYPGMNSIYDKSTPLTEGMKHIYGNGTIPVKIISFLYYQHYHL